MKTIKLIAITVLAVAYTHLGSATETMSAPKRSDYESFKDYWDARVAWKAEQKNIEPQNIPERIANVDRRCRQPNINQSRLTSVFCCLVKQPNGQPAL